jgi:branched-chain amino acid transport system permease protein
MTQAMHGLVYGMLLFLVASGLTLVLGMMGVLNLAHTSLLYVESLFCLFNPTLFGELLV